MRLQGKKQRSIEWNEKTNSISILDQTLLPFNIKWIEINTFDGVCDAISTMKVRGAPMIGAVAGFGIVFALKEKLDLTTSSIHLKDTRPTAINLAWAVDRVLKKISTSADKETIALAEAIQICNEDERICSEIGNHGLTVFESILSQKKENKLNVLTHCNAGWLATVDWGTALAPIYKAHEKGLNIHVWVDETRPRNQGALLTAFELKEQGVPHTLIADNTGGFLMQTGQVDVCIVGTDRTTSNGDVCNKIGTYLKALAAHDNEIPFYVGLPSSTIDFNLRTGKEIPIEYRKPEEVLTVLSHDDSGKVFYAPITIPGINAINPGFDVTPAKYITGLITEFGVFPASEEGMKNIKSRMNQ
jgi:methylthioribose-1-phosphate isomerase